MAVTCRELLMPVHVDTSASLCHTKVCMFAGIGKMNEHDLAPGLGSSSFNTVLCRRR